MLRRFSGISPALFVTLILTLLTDCTSRKTEAETRAEQAEETSVIAYETVEDKSSLASLYELEHIKEWYPERVLPPVFDYSVDISGNSITELWLLRNEVFARNGYLFEDAVLRGYFSQFKWYQPIFDVPDFKVRLNQEEQDFVNRVLERENELRNERYITADSYKMINVDQVYNRVQFKNVPADLNNQLAKTNFAIVPASHEQFFHVYDRNHYEYIPSFITTDIYLQVLHKHFSSILRRTEEEKFTPLLTDLLKKMLQESLQSEKTISDARLRKAAQWSSAYLAIGYYLLSGNPQLVSDEMRQYYDEETVKISDASGMGSEFLQSKLIQYSQFAPRSNYTKTPELENYFRCMKWLNTAPMYIDNDERLLSAVLLASLIKQSPSNLQAFDTFNNAVRFIVGEEDNLSIAHIINSISDDEALNPALLNDPEKLKALRKKLEAVDPDKIKPQAASADAASGLSKPSVLFTAGRYTFDAEILSKLVHVLQPTPRRPFPKGLDVFASLANKEAENILMKEYNEAKQWDGYPKALSKMKDQFSKYDAWNQNIYSKTFEAINSLSKDDQRYPLFMKTPAWQRKNLVTSLAAWTELKHDMLLYAEQPYAAQAGEGGGPPPPQHIGYVEPNVAFWKKALELIDLQEKTLEQQNLLGEDVKGINDDLRQIGNFLLTVSEKELNNEPLDAKEFDEISWMGGRIEYLTFRIFDSDHLPEKERLVALAADVYRFNNQYLEEATGLVDEIYVIAEINGKPYLTKGAVFSYYEFTSNSPLTDEQWQEQLLGGKAPQRPAWVKGMMVEKASLESQPWFSF